MKPRWRNIGYEKLSPDIHQVIFALASLAVGVLSVSARPDRLILGYPVVSFVTKYHAGSAAKLLSPNPSEEVRRQLSGELHVTEQTPTTFLFHTADDAAVPVENSLNFTAACAAQKVPVALHVFPDGQHGVGMATDDPVLKRWTELLLDWLKAW